VSGGPVPSRCPGARSFIDKGVDGRRRDTLEPALSAAYEAKARAELGDECAAWFAGQ
jgi:aryl sulfotransferase